MDKKAIKGEVAWLLAVAAAMIVIMKVVFYKQDIATTTRTALSIFWMMTLPGYALLHYWKEKLGFMERIVIGTAAGAAVTAIASYYLGLLGMHVKYHGIVLPVAMLITGYFFSFLMTNGSRSNAKKAATTESLNEGTILPK